MRSFSVTVIICWLATDLFAAEPIEVWNGMPPGETVLNRGEVLPPRGTNRPPVTRVEKITQPTMDAFPAEGEKRTDVGVIILPGGGFNYVVPDMEGAEIARWLNGLGISAWVLRYRTKDGSDIAPWKRPMADAQRAVSLIRSKAGELKIDPKKIGLMGISSGGQVGARVGVAGEARSYEGRDAIDRASCRPDFLMLIYPWNIWDAEKKELVPGARPTGKMPPTFLLHTHDDGSSSLGTVMYYAALKEMKVPAELHVYQAGGHGYGMRQRPGTAIHTWTERAADWLRLETTGLGLAGGGK
ncbi:MAG: alpha/beta hydrolase [Planctomycetales bacterium]